MTGFINENENFADSTAKRAYYVIAKSSQFHDQIQNELIRDTSADDSVDSNVIPDRIVDIAKSKPSNPLVTMYYLTDDEVKKINQDERVQGIDLWSSAPDKMDAVQTGNWNKSPSSTGQYDNWGLLRHISATNNFGTSTSISGTYDYVLDGTGVDVVIQDSGIQADHPEWQDANGVSRLKQIDWETASGLTFGGSSMTGYNSSLQYTDTNGHGTHVAGTVAGKTFGWAKNADIYSQKINLSGAGGIAGGCLDISDVTGNGDTPFDVIRLWHNKKNNPSDPSYTGRPTVVQMSWGSGFSFSTDANGSYFQSGSTNYYLSGIEYRGVRTNLTNHSSATAINLGMSPQGEFKFYSTSRIAEITNMINDGIIVSKSAGNGTCKHEISTGPDWNNELFVTVGLGDTEFGLWLHRTDFGPDELDGFTVGALDSTGATSSADRKKGFSDAGPGVNIWSAGTNIISAMKSTSGGSYYYNGSFRQAVYSGTSMAGPQVAGLCALVLQAHPDWTPKQIYNWVIDHATATITGTGNSTSYGDDQSLLGAPNKVLWLPMNGEKTFNIG